MLLHYVFIAWPHHYSSVFILKDIYGESSNSHRAIAGNFLCMEFITKSAANSTICLICNLPVFFQIYSIAVL